MTPIDLNTWRWEVVGVRGAARVRLAAPTVDETLSEVVLGVLNTALVYGADRFADSVRSRRGQAFEGNVSYIFGTEYPEEAPSGCVVLDFFEHSIVVTESSFIRVALDVVEMVRKSGH